MITLLKYFLETLIVTSDTGRNGNPRWTLSRNFTIGVYDNTRICAREDITEASLIGTGGF